MYIMIKYNINRINNLNFTNNVLCKHNCMGYLKIDKNDTKFKNRTSTIKYLYKCNAEKAIKISLFLISFYLRPKYYDKYYKIL